METLRQLIDIFLHLDAHLKTWAASLGSTLYAVLFLIVFCETGLVVTPFLPGDSLLFTVGALVAIEGSGLSLPVVLATLFAAAVIGDAVNYSIGRRLGPRAFRSDKSLLFNKKHLERTQAFYERYGGKTIMIARFVPVVRTFAPFVAGIGRMQYRRFLAWNLAGAGIWVASVTLLGYWFGNLPPVKKNFEYVVIAIVVLSVVPGVVEFVRERRRAPAPNAG
jgi:membrane-associated protein